MCNNKLKLNKDKTEAILFSTPSLSSCHCLPSSIMVGTHEILFSDKIRNLGFILDSNLTMKQHVIRTCQTAYYELKRISSIRRYLTEDAAKQHVTSCVLSRLDYCNSLNSQGHSEHCNSTNAESPKYYCTPHSQSSMTSKLHTSPTATPLAPNFWTDKIQNCLHVLQRNHRFRSLLSFWAATPLQSFPLSLLFVRHRHAQNLTLQLQNR